jgi:hypothetical protein
MRPPRRPRRRWEYNIKMDLKVIGWEGVNESISLRIRTTGGLL